VVSNIVFPPITPDRNPTKILLENEKGKVISIKSFKYIKVLGEEWDEFWEKYIFIKNVKLFKIMII